LPKKRLNFWGNNFRGSALEGVLKSSSITGKGEVGDLGSSLLRSNSEGMGNGVDGLVQGRSHVVDGIGGNKIEMRRERSSQLHLVQIIFGRLRVRLNNSGVWSCIQEYGDL